MNVSGLVLWQDVWWAPRRKLCGFFKIKRRQDVATRADIGVCTWQMDRGSHVVNNCHLYPLKPFISQGLQVSEVICCFIAVGGNNFNLVLEDKKDISIFWYTWSFLQVSVNVQKCLKWKWLQYKLGILSSNFRIEFCKTQCHTQWASPVSRIYNFQSF